MSLILSGTDGLSDVDGTAATPAIRGTDANTGIFFGTDIIGFSEGGVEAARINADSQFVAAAGTAALPVITTTGDTNTGIFFPAADTIAFSEGGAECARFDSGSRLLVGLTSSIASNGIAQIGGNADTRLIIDGSSTQGIFFTKSGADNGTYRVDASGNYNWFVLGAATANMTLNTSGNLGIGTTSPVTPLNVVSNSGAVGVQINGRSSDGIGVLKFTNNAGSTETARLQVDTTPNLIFCTGNAVTERMRIDSSGNLLVGTTSTTINTTNFGAYVAQDGGIFASRNQDGSVVTFYFGGNAGAFRLLGNGNAQNTNNSYGPIASDPRLKENIDYNVNYLEDLMRLRVCKFSYKTESLDAPNQLGFLTNNVKEVFPKLIEIAGKAEDFGLSPNEPNVETYKASVMLPMAIRAIQEQQALITTLTARITALEGA